MDDENAIVDAICEFLDLQNITADKANDGYEALELLAKYRYDAIISDIRMPGSTARSSTKKPRRSSPPTAAVFSS